MPLFFRIQANFLPSNFLHLSTVETVFGGTFTATRGVVNARKLFKSITHVGSREYVDWHEANTLEEAKQIHAQEASHAGLPKNYTVQFIEVDPETLKPVKEHLIP